MLRRSLESTSDAEVTVGYNPHNNQYWGYVLAADDAGERHFLVEIEDRDPGAVINAVRDHAIITEDLERVLRADAAQHAAQVAPETGSDPPSAVLESDLHGADFIAPAPDTGLELG
jgi:hypothetical protein